MESSSTLLSIITVTSRDIERLKQTISSISSLDDRIEHVIVVPISDRETRRFLDEIRLELGHQFVLVTDLGKGIYEAMTLGVEASIGNFFTFWNSGDCLTSKLVLEELLHELTRQESGWLICDGAFDGTKAHEPSNAMLRSFILQEKFGYISHQCVLFSKKAFSGQPYFNLSYRVAADTDQIFRLFSLSAPTFLPISVVKVEQGNYSALHHRRARLEILLIIFRNLRGKSRIISLKNFLLTNLGYLFRKISQI